MMNRKNKKRMKSVVYIRSNAHRDKPMRVSSSLNELEWLDELKATPITDQADLSSKKK